MLRSIAFSLLCLAACDRDPAPAPTSADGEGNASAPVVRAEEAPVSTTAAPAAGEGGDGVASPAAVEATVLAPAPAPAVVSDPKGSPSPSPGAGDGCRDASGCGAGETCVGDGLAGCGGEPGRCERDALCSRDAQPYCGCDGETFRASGQCPGREFAYRGECRADGAKVGAAGAACSSGDECGSGICEGQGCGPNKLGRCVAGNRVCTTDAVVYCGCDNRSFRSSSQCPGRRYRNRGDCHA